MNGDSLAFLTVVVLLVSSVCPAAQGDAVHCLLEGQRDFDGLSDVLEVQLPDETRGYSNVTVTGWIFPRVPAGPVRNRYIVTVPFRFDLGMMSNVDNARPLDTTGPLVGSLYTQNADGGWSGKTVSSPEPLKADRWTHVAMTYDGETIRLFMDGAEVAAVAETGALSQDGRTTRGTVGCRVLWWGNSSFWAGLLHDVRIHGVALPAEAIGELAASTPAIPPADRVFRSDGPPVWVFNGELEGTYRASKERAFPLHWYGSLWGDARGRWQKDTDYAHAGEAALMIECDALTLGGISFHQSDARIALVPGRTYTLSAWMRSDFDVEVEMGIRADGPSPMKRFRAVRRWQEYTLRTTHTGLTSSGFIIFYYMSKRPGNLVIDDVELTVEE